MEECPRCHQPITETTGEHQRFEMYDGRIWHLSCYRAERTQENWKRYPMSGRPRRGVAPVRVSRLHRR